MIRSVQVRGERGGAHLPHGQPVRGHARGGRAQAGAQNHWGQSQVQPTPNQCGHTVDRIANLRTGMKMKIGESLHIFGMAVSLAA